MTETIKDILKISNIVFLAFFALAFSLTLRAYTKARAELKDAEELNNRLTLSVESLTFYAGELREVIVSNADVCAQQLTESEKICGIAKRELMRKRELIKAQSQAKSQAKTQETKISSNPRGSLGGTPAGGNQAVSDETSNSVVCFINGVFGVSDDDGGCRDGEILP